jgi:hypothetical protein
MNHPHTNRGSYSTPCRSKIAKTPPGNRASEETAYQTAYQAMLKGSIAVAHPHFANEMGTPSFASSVRRVSMV